MTHRLTLIDITPVTHDTNRLRLPRPDGYAFTPGQATDLAIDRDGWREEKRPFTFTSQPDEPELEFVIKSYPDHDGVTEQIAGLTVGDEVLIGDPWGAIKNKGGPALFIAGGAGITPFIPILRKRRASGQIGETRLVFSNRTEADIILRDEWEGMPGLDPIFVVTDQPDSALPHGPVDRDFLAPLVDGFDGHAYICGPDKMVTDLAQTLRDLGLPDDRIVHEDLG